MHIRAVFLTPLRSGLLLAAALSACGHQLKTSLSGASPAPVPDVFECVKNQLKALGYSQTSIDVDENRINAKKYDETVRRPDVNFRRMVDRMEVQVAPAANGGVTSLEVTVRTFAELTTQRGPTEEQDRTSDRATADGQTLVQQCGGDRIPATS